MAGLTIEQLHTLLRVTSSIFRHESPANQLHEIIVIEQKIDSFIQRKSVLIPSECGDFAQIAASCNANPLYTGCPWKDPHFVGMCLFCGKLPTTCSQNGVHGVLCTLLHSPLGTSHPRALHAVITICHWEYVVTSTSPSIQVDYSLSEFKYYKDTFHMMPLLSDVTAGVHNFMEAIGVKEFTWFQENLKEFTHYPRRDLPHWVKLGNGHLYWVYMHVSLLLFTICCNM